MPIFNTTINDKTFMLQRVSRQNCDKMVKKHVSINKTENHQTSTKNNKHTFRPFCASSPQCFQIHDLESAIKNGVQLHTPIGSREGNVIFIFQTFSDIFAKDLPKTKWKMKFFLKPREK